MKLFYNNISTQFKSILSTLVEGQKKVAVIGHMRPDGDCIGSTVAMVRLLRSQGVQAIGVNQDVVPDNLNSFLGDTPFITASEFENQDHVAVTVDCADVKRIGKAMDELFPKIFLNIDHHISNKNYAEHNIVIGTASATTEILTGLALDLELAIDATSAQALYVGIATDTGQFCYSSTTKETFEMVQSLLECGANPAAAANDLYENESYARIQLIQAFLASLEMHLDNRVCVGTITDAMYKQTGATIDDADGLVDYARSIKGVEIGVLVEERSGAIKGSLRSKDPKYRVDQIAQVFGGGGHACAAGLNVSDASIETFKPKLLSEITNQLTKIHSA
jgi:phosphoesterase RecJ-like protein